MKKYMSICIVLAAAITFTGCGDNKTNKKLIGTNVYDASSGPANPNNPSTSNTGPLTGTQNTVMLSEVFTGFSAAVSGGTLSPGKPSSLSPAFVRTLMKRTTTSIPSTIITGTLGGSVTVSGSFTVNDDFSVVTFDVSETWAGLTWKSDIDKGTYSMSGTITLTGTENVNATGSAVLFTEKLKTSDLVFHYGSS